MTNRNYVNGQKVAYAAAADLRANGYQTMMSAGSKGKIDVMAFKGPPMHNPGHREILFVQCKTDVKDTPPAERAELRRLAAMIGATPLLAGWHKEGRAARTVRYWCANSPGPVGEIPWTPDYGLEAS